jgi:hypothetical protein
MAKNVPVAELLLRMPRLLVFEREMGFMMNYAAKRID